MELMVIGDEDTVTGFQLAGVGRTFVVKSADEARAALEKSAESGMVIISERFAEQIKAEIGRMQEGRLFPMVVEIPDKKGRIERPDPLAHVIKMAVGIDISTKEVKKGD